MDAKSTLNSNPSSNSSSKILTLPPPPPPPKSVAMAKPRTKRAITRTEKWHNECHNEHTSEQTNSMFLADPKSTILDRDGPRTDNETFSQYFTTFRDPSGNSLLAQQIRQKISGYRSQDVEKGILDKEAFVTFSHVVELLRQSDRLCYYCQEPVLLLYEYVREPKQWTLERLDNAYGHNEGNVVVACLRCNLKRRCIASERYVKTKQMSNIVKVG